MRMPDHERADLRRCRLAVHDLVHDEICLFFGQRRARAHALDGIADTHDVRSALARTRGAADRSHDLRPRRWTPVLSGTSPARSRKFASSFVPSGVSTLSGWNCTPKIGLSAWRTAITTPSGVRAWTISGSATLSLFTHSEW